MDNIIVNSALWYAEQSSQFLANSGANKLLDKGYDYYLTPPTIEIVGFLGGGGKAYHHAAYKAASYAVSHQQLRV